MKKFIKAIKTLYKDQKIPKWLKWMVGFGLLPIPGPFDEIVLGIVGIIMWIFYKERLKAAWNAN